MVPGRILPTGWTDSSGSGCDYETESYGMISFDLLAQAVVGGLLLGLIYGAMALGLSITMGVLQVINVAHSTFVILGSFGAYFFLNQLGLDPLLSVLPAVPIFFVLGMLVERTVVRRLADAPQEVGLLVLFGLMVVLESVMVLLWTTDTRAVTSSRRASEAPVARGARAMPACVMLERATMAEPPGVSSVEPDARK